MKRREFITLVGGVAAWPLAARAQQQSVSTVRHIGFLLPGVARTMAVRGLLEAFRQGLKEYGWVEEQNISVDYRFANGKVAETWLFFDGASFAAQLSAPAGK